ncbi:hypothetical protein B0H63DRAFT_451333 [Podospora didyma]|uniref:DUF6536 domain-containing protein n=1 Tax=Podospora didyma TaxID=330526 RepID=A0AAE0KJ46_9PEZI|nr:hypothetical protein B0H63DRAFT_451333 [Podospora didyma]
MASSSKWLSSTGWRRTAVINTILIGLLSLLLLGLLMWSSIKAGGIEKVHIFFEGYCASSRQRNFAVHFLLNSLSTGIIASSNFFMQVLNSPSRIEADKAHEKEKYVEIGVPSIKNFPHVARLKTMLWVGFCLSSVPIHLFFNSAIFETDYRGSQWHLTIADKWYTIDWRFGESVDIGEYLNPASDAMKNLSRTAAEASGWKRLSPKDCRAENSCLDALGAGKQPASTSNAYDLDLVAPWRYTFNYLQAIPLFSGSILFYGSMFRDQSFNVIEVDYCLAQEVTPVCKIGTSNLLLLIVTICVGVKAAQCLFVVRRFHGHDYFVTPGNAMASYLANPDPIRDAYPSFLIFRGVHIPPNGKPKKWKKKARRPSHGISRDDLFHQIQTKTVTTPFFKEGDLIGSILTANFPQIILSTWYFLYNTMFTRILASKEWNSFSCSGYRSLRVTDPQEEQTSTYRLQLPYRYSIPMVFLSICMHWFVSSAMYVFIVEGGYHQGTMPVRVEGEGLSHDAFVSIGFSTIAVLVVSILPVLMLVAANVFSMRKMPGDMMPGGTNSFVISSACHSSTAMMKVGIPPPSRRSNDSLTISTELSSSFQPYDKDQNQSLYASEEAVYSNGDEEPSACISEDTGPDRAALLLQLSRSKLRWSAVPMPVELQNVYNGDENANLIHLSFGTVEQDVQEPEDGWIFQLPSHLTLNQDVAAGGNEAKMTPSPSTVPLPMPPFRW